MDFCWRHLPEGVASHDNSETPGFSVQKEHTETLQRLIEVLKQIENERAERLKAEHRRPNWELLAILFVGIYAPLTAALEGILSLAEGSSRILALVLIVFYLILATFLLFIVSRSGYVKRRNARDRPDERRD
jgi:hypothetical protein